MSPSLQLAEEPRVRLQQLEKVNEGQIVKNMQMWKPPVYSTYIVLSDLYLERGEA